MNPAEEFGAIPVIFLSVFAAAVVLIVCGWIVGAVKVVRNRRVLQEAGIDPSTVGSQLAVRYLRGQTAPTGRPAVRSTSDRLAELTDLRDRGLITPDEYQARRTRILDSI